MLRIYNSLTKQKESFRPLNPHKVSLYICGVTVYDFCHLGHSRTYTMMDVAINALKYLGYDVEHVRNITDIDDKIIKRANENNEPCDELTERFIQAMYEDEAKLGIAKPDQDPRATAFVQPMVDMIQVLIDKGAAYVAENGDVCYEVRSFKNYGKLSNRDLDDMRSGERVDIEKAKKDPLDFVLWKMSKPGEPAWPSPWGEGRPGWHSECSVMSNLCLGKTIDIHAGGMDLLFPHHENELAQAEVANDCEFVKTWMHFGFLNINSEKMSKSLKNFYTIREVLDEYDPECVRYFFLTAHYRKPLNYDHDTSINQTKPGLERLYNALRGLNITDAAVGTDFEKQFISALEDDFNTPEALAALFDLAREINKHKEQNSLEADALGALLKKLAFVLGILQRDPDEFLQAGDVDVAKIESLIEKRNQARAEKDFQTSDAIRDELKAMGIELEDKAGQTTWRKV